MEKRFNNKDRFKQGYYENEIDGLEPYQRMIQYNAKVILSETASQFLDDMNFTNQVFSEIFHLSDLEKLYPAEHGYRSPDGSYELHRFIEELEYARLVKLDPERNSLFENLIQSAQIGTGQGTANVVYGIMRSILKLPKEVFPRINQDPEIILHLPTYTVYTGQMTQMKNLVTARYITTSRENDFLPTFEEIESAVTDKTIAILLTYPSNPSQATYEGELINDLRKLVQFCQKEGIFLIVDNIYQDMLFPIGRKFSEIFQFTNSVDYLFKVYGSSKDTPFFSGYRTGYWIGDPRIGDIYKYFISSTETSMNSLSQLFFALNLYGKLLVIKNIPPALEHMEYFTYGLFGLSHEVDTEKLFYNFSQLNLNQKYKVRIAESNQIQEGALR